MVRRYSSRFRLFPLICVLAACSAAAFADGAHERTQFGRNITVEPDEQISEATCFGCSIHVRGHVDGDVTTFGGSIILDDQAEVTGDATSFGGNIRLESGVKVAGDVTIFGGHLRRDPGTTIGGEVTNFGSNGWLLLIFGLPLVVLGAFIALIVWLVRMALRPSVPATT